MKNFMKILNKMILKFSCKTFLRILCKKENISNSKKTILKNKRLFKNTNLIKIFKNSIKILIF